MCVGINLYDCFFIIIALPIPTCNTVRKSPCAFERNFISVIERPYADIRFFRKPPNPFHKFAFGCNVAFQVYRSRTCQQRQTFVTVISPIADTRFAEIVPSSPHEIAYKSRYIFDFRPIIRQIFYHSFRAEHHSFGIFFTVDFIS